MLETAAALTGAAVDAAVAPAPTAAPETSRFGGRFYLDPAPIANIAPAQTAGLGAGERLAASRHLLAQSPGERLLDRLFTAADALRRPPHRDLVAALDRAPGVDGASSPTTAADPETLRELTETSLRRYQSLSERAIAVQLWSARTQLTTAVAAKGLQGINTLLKNQG